MTSFVETKKICAKESQYDPKWFMNEKKMVKLHKTTARNDFLILGINFTFLCDF